MVTHPFHVLVGRRLAVVFEMRSRRGLLFVCQLDGQRRVTLRQEWTDRGAPAGDERLAVEGLVAARQMIDTVACRITDPNANG